VLHYLTLAGFSVLLIAAAFEDLRRLIIPNLLTIGLCLLWPVYFAAAPSLTGALAAIGCGLGVFLVGGLLFARGYVGGGDVKLLSAAALWAGPTGTPSLLVLTGLIGGALALLLLMPGGSQIAEMVRLRWGCSPMRTDGGTPVPYGIAIASAALIVIVSPNLS
jgi:prepilin peptidase CpaA